MKTLIVLTAFVAATCALQTGRSIFDTVPLKLVLASLQCSQTDVLKLLQEACTVESEVLACIQSQRKNIIPIVKKCFATDIASFKAAENGNNFPEPVKFLDCITDKTIDMFTGKARKVLSELECYQM